MQLPGTATALKNELKPGDRFDGLIFAPDANGKLKLGKVKKLPAGTLMEVPKTEQILPTEEKP